MPWTFAHPAAVIPLRRCCPEVLNFPALVVGSLTPDLGYHLRMTRLAFYAHSVEGSFVVCLPVGLLVLGLICLARKPAWYLLPQPHRSALAALATSHVSSLRPLALLAIVVSVLIGAWAHIAWDAMTHNDGWLVLRLSPLQAPLFHVGGVQVHVYTVFQDLSTAVGLAAIAIVYVRWLRRTQAAAALRFFHRDDRWRYGMLGAIAAAAGLVAVAAGSLAAAGFHGYYAWSTFVFRAAVDGMSAFVVLYLSGSVICYCTRRTA